MKLVNVSFVCTKSFLKIETNNICKQTGLSLLHIESFQIDSISMREFARHRNDKVTVKQEEMFKTWKQWQLGSSPRHSMQK